MTTKRVITVWAVTATVLCAIFALSNDWQYRQRQRSNRTIETLNRELAGQMFEVRRAREVAREMDRLRFIAQAFETNDSNIYQTAVAAYKWGRVYGVSPHLIMAVAHRESNFDPMAVSSAGAVGIMQIMPDVWKRELNIDVNYLHNIDYNVQQGTRILKYYLDKYGGVSKSLFHYWGGDADRHGYGYPDRVLGSRYFTHDLFEK